MSGRQRAPSPPARRNQTSSPWVLDLPAEIDRWLHIARNSGTVTVFTGKVEVGQNIRTSLAQVVAEELRLSPSDIRMVMGDTDRAPFDIGTVGSMTTPIMAAHLRRVAAATREFLIDRAAARWRVPRCEIVAAEGRASHIASGRSLSYGELTHGRKLTHSAGDDVVTTPAARWTTAGTSLPRVNGKEIVTGRHRYPSDVKRPGMLCGKILRPPSLVATLVSVDAREAGKIQDVRVVRDDSLVGVVAADETTATRALAALSTTWDISPLPGEDDPYTYLKTHPADIEEGRFDGPVREEFGSVEEGFAAGDHTLRQTYTVAYIAHAPLEPRVAVAEWHDGRLTVWTGTQRPFGVRSELAAAFGLDEDDVRVIVPDTGSGYGGKHTGEVAREAACLARAVGAPVRLAWTREEEFSWAYVRPAGVIEISSAATTDGTLTAWDCRNYNSGAQGIRPLYDIPHQRLAFDPQRSPLRQGSYRALAATANHFARETHIDEMSVAVGLDPLAFRLRNLRDPRLRAVLEAAVERFGWASRQTRAPGRGAGLAVGSEKGSYVATCCEIAVDGSARNVRIVRVVQAFECGAIVNPDGLQNQVEGAIVQALGGALFERVELANGRIQSAGFSCYRVPRFSDVPAIETILLDRRDLPSAGAGETPIIGLAPAVGNAIFACTGIRLRSLPLAPHGVVDECPASPTFR
jgi:nicotinate dehydrogenase subunit B